MSSPDARPRRGPTSWRVFVSGDDADGPLAYIYGGWEAPTLAAAEAWVSDNLPRYAAQTPPDVRITALLEQGTYVLTGHAGSAHAATHRGRHYVWMIDRSMSRVGQLNSDGLVEFRARTVSVALKVRRRQSTPQGRAG